MKKPLKKLVFPIMGISALIWFLIRVVPKPSRASYPCVRAAAPIASSFVLFLLGLASSVMFFKKAKYYLYQSRYAMFSVAIAGGIILSLSAHLFNNKQAIAMHTGITEEPNQPIGTGIGIYPGRVTWIHNANATNENCKNTNNDFWWKDGNTKQIEVDKMVSQAIQSLTGTASDTDAWDALFHNYNNNHNKGDVGYTSGEKIVIKLNLNCSWDGAEINTSPQITYAILDQLINRAGVAQSDISIGDPGRDLNSAHKNKCVSDFPDVNYWGTNSGQTPIVQSDDFEFFTSDGEVNDYLPKCYLEADYMINIPVLKKHDRSGVSLSSKNHFGTFVPFNGMAMHYHPSLPCPQNTGDVSNGEYGTYRVFVDIMGHKHLGGKTILYLIDGLWSSINYGHPPIKWRMAPFNNDWPSSIFVSQDPVAIESVGFDFLRSEFDNDHPTEGGIHAYPQYAGTDDFLHQGASSENWPAGITYDPENDGSNLPESMGVHEHWNNATDKQYSRNLGTGEGIELIAELSTSINETKKIANNGILQLKQNFPNPFISSTSASYKLSSLANVKVSVFDSNGKTVRVLIQENQNSGDHLLTWDGTDINGSNMQSGTYFIEVEAETKNQAIKQTIKLIKK